MLTYAAEVCAVISLAVACVALPVTAIGFGIEVLRSTLRERRTSLPAPASTGRTGACL
jgi:hypothetical protein